MTAYYILRFSPQTRQIAFVLVICTPFRYFLDIVYQHLIRAFYDVWFSFWKKTCRG
jgi:hypothetical protein